MKIKQFGLALAGSAILLISGSTMAETCGLQYGDTSVPVDTTCKTLIFPSFEGKESEKYSVNCKSETAVPISGVLRSHPAGHTEPQDVRGFKVYSYVYGDPSTFTVSKTGTVHFTLSNVDLKDIKDKQVNIACTLKK